MDEIRPAEDKDHTMGPFEYSDLITAGELLEGLFRVTCFAPTHKVLFLILIFLKYYDVILKIKQTNSLYQGECFLTFWRRNYFFNFSTSCI